MISLTACALGTLSVLPKFKTPVYKKNLHGQVATIGVGDLKQTIAPAIITQIPDETLVAYQECTSITNKLQAVIAARAFLDTTRLQPTKPPKVISVTEEHPNVWKIIFEGDWMVIPPDPNHTFTPPPPEHGCVYVTINTIDLVVSKLGTIGCSL